MDMPTGRAEASVAHPGMTSVMEAVGELSDEELIERFLNAGRDEAEAAFRIMVIRHGPMVLGVCRHVLNQHQDAEDAFQATFIALARKAGSIKDRRGPARRVFGIGPRFYLPAQKKEGPERAVEKAGG